MKLLLYTILTVLCLISYPNLSQAQIQKGKDINGEDIGDNSGSSISMPDANTIAIGAPENDSKGILGQNSGHVKVYVWKRNKWVQKGADINGETERELSGYRVSMPDSNTVAISAILNNEKDYYAGQVRIYSWNGTKWIQKGADINGKEPLDQIGLSLSMPDSNTVAFGDYGYKGHVRIYSWNGTKWIQKGADIEGRSNDAAGSISMPNANTIALNFRSTIKSRSDSGIVRVFDWNGTKWVQKGIDIVRDVKGTDRGVSISMPDANTIAIGAYLNDGNGSESGHVRIFTWNGTKWTQKGANIEGEAAGDQSGVSVSMPNANIVAIGAYLNDGNGSKSGHVRIYAWDGKKWVQKGIDIDGEAANDKSGVVSMPNSNTVAIGAPGNQASTGHVRIYEFCYTSITPIYINECSNIYTTPSGKATYTSDGVYLDTLHTKKNCDSIFEIDLKFVKSSVSLLDINSCTEYKAPSGAIYTSTGVYTDTIENAVGCDSIITINFTLLESTKSTIDINSCAEYKAPSGAIYTSTGVYTDTIENAVGCDSIITINFTLLESTKSTIDINSCTEYQSPSGAIYVSTGVYTDTIENISGCDSIITIDLTIDSVEIKVTEKVNSLEATAQNAKYQWLDCAEGYSKLPQATNQLFTPSKNGEYAVEITQGNCTDTSACYIVNIVGFAEAANTPKVQIFPSPTTTNQVQIDLGVDGQSARVSISNLQGQILQVENIKGSRLINLPATPAWYLIKVQTKDGLPMYFKVLKL